MEKKVANVKKPSNKKRKGKVVTALTAFAVLISTSFGVFLTGCKNNNNNRIVADEPPKIVIEQPIDNPIEDPGTEIEDPGTEIEDPGTGNEDPGTGNEDPGTGTEEYTEAEYKQMCEDKLVDLAKDSFTAKYPGYALGDIEFKIIDKLNNSAYFVGEYANKLRLIEVSFNENIFNYENYSDLYNNSFKNRKANSNADFVFNENIYSSVSSTSYNEFLDTIVKDQGFKDALVNEGITISDNMNEWRDIASVVNISSIDRESVRVQFIDLNSEKTIDIMVYADLNIQESATIQIQIDNLTIKDKTYTMLEIKDFGPFSDPNVAQNSPIYDYGIEK